MRSLFNRGEVRVCRLCFFYIPSGTMRLILQHIFAPLIWTGFIGLGTWMVGSRDLAPVWLLVLLPPALLLVFVAEAGLPYAAQWNRNLGDRRRDLAHALVNESLNVAVLAAVAALGSLVPSLEVWPVQAPFWSQVLLAIVAADLGITLVHRLSHRWWPLWRLHAVHHSVQRMYGFNGLMKHPLHQGLEALGGVAPLLLLGMPLKVAAVLALAIYVQLLLQHCNVDIRQGGWLRFFAWAPVHRYHHLRYGRAGDVNFGLFFTFWDRLMGTAFDGRGYRLSSADLGIGSRPDYPVAWLPQLLEPFRPGADQVPPPLPPGLASLRRR